LSKAVELEGIITCLLAVGTDGVTEIIFVVVVALTLPIKQSQFVKSPFSKSILGGQKFVATLFSFRALRPSEP
jgi:hypothetical protein